MPQSQKTVLTDLSTEELVERAQQDDMKAIEALVKRFQRMVYVTLHQMAPDCDTADLTQDVLLRMCRSIKSVKNPKTFKYWLNRIIVNRFYDELRKKPRKLQTVSLDAPAYRDDDSDSGPQRDVADAKRQPDTLALDSELDSHIHEAISNLPEQFRTIIVLREIQGLSYEEIAGLLNVNLGTVKSRLARARLKLQETLAPYLQGK